MAALSLSFLGPFTATLIDQPLDNFRTNKIQALLIYLAVEKDRPHRREALFTLLWPGMPEKSARHNLNQTLYKLRQTFPEAPVKNNEDPVPFVQANRQTIQFNPDAAVYVDIHRVDELLTVTQSHAHPNLAACPNCIDALENALALFRGDFLSDFYLDDSSEFEAWAEAVREGYRRKQVDILATLADISIQNNKYDQAIKHIDRQLAIDDLDERAHRQKIEMLALSGRRVEAMRHYRAFKQNLEAQLGTAPSQDITTLYERISKDDLPTAKPWPEPVATKPGIPETDTPRHNLPAQSTPFIGRKTDSAEFDKLIPDPETANPPAGTVTFLFTDIQGSTPLWESEPEKMAAALKIHNAALRQAIEAHGGSVFKTVGDSFQAAFSTAPQALDAAIQGQHALKEANWNELGELKVRMGLHTGEAQLDPGGDEYAVSHTKNRAARIMSAAHGGQVLLSQETKELVDHQLPDGMTLKDLGEHRLKGMELPEQLYQASALGLQMAFPLLKTGAHPRHNLPPQPTPFIGREDELDQLDRMLQGPDSRLITIIGPGGMGKTRLAIACAERQLDRRGGSETHPYSDGVFFVDLAPLNEPDQMVSAVSDAINYRLQSEGARNLQQQLFDYLESLRILLILDNCEHLLDGVDFIADLLNVAPGLQILATSRERLHLHTEQVYPIEGLEFPDWETPEDAVKYTAVRLFLQSAHRNRPDFSLDDDDDLALLTRICRLVAGMPLALELAASWVDMLPLSEIAAGLQAGLDFLESEMHDLPPRHRSVRAAIDHSWGKLDPKERLIFSQLSVFRGGFTRDAAQVVVGANLRQLRRLVNKSFLRYDQAPDRYQVHELMRQYGAEKRSETGESAATRDQHCQFFCTRLHQWEAVLNSDQIWAAVKEIESDTRNIELAWQYALDQAHLDRLLVAVSGLGEYYDASGRWFEGINLFQESDNYLQSGDGEIPASPEAARLRILLAAWQVNLDINTRGNNINPENAHQQYLQPALDLLQLPVLSGKDCRQEEAFLRLQLGRILKRIPENWELGKTHLDVCLSLYRALEDPLGVSDALYELHFYASDIENYLQSQKLLEESLSILPQPNEPRRQNRLLIAQGVLAWEMQNFAEADDRYEQAYRVSKDAGFQIGMFDARHLAVQQAWYLGHFEQALSLSRQAIALAQEAANPHRAFVAYSLEAVTLVFLGEFTGALDKGHEITRHKDKHHIRVDLGYWQGNGLPMAHMHAGHYQLVVGLLKSTWVLDMELWLQLIRSDFQRASTFAQQRLKEIRPQDHGWRSQIQTACALALFHQDDIEEARKTLSKVLRSCIQWRTFLPLMHLIPVTALVLADSDDDLIKGRALEIWAMAQNYPFVGNSRLFADLIGQPMEIVAASLPAEVVESLRASGRQLDWWETAETLLGELTALGWDEARDVHS